MKISTRSIGRAPFGLSAVFLLALCPLATASSLAVDGHYRIIAAEDSQAPGMAPGTVFTQLFGAAINESGHVALYANVGIPGARGTIWTDAGGTLTKIAQDGDPGPVAGTTFRGLDLGPGMDRYGNVVFTAGLDGSASVREGIFTASAGAAPTKIAVQGDPAIGGGTHDTFWRPWINAAGDVMFGGWLADEHVDTGAALWYGTTAGASSMVTRKGNPAPGFVGDVSIHDFYSPQLTPAGDVVYDARITGEGVEGASDYLTYRNSTLIAREGDPAPGTGPDVRFRENVGTYKSLGGDALLRAALTGPGVNVANEDGLWKMGAAGPALLARSGSHAPGLAADHVIGVAHPSVMNEAGQVAFVASSYRPAAPSETSLGVWTDSLGNGLELLAETGDPAAGTPDTFTNFLRPALNGQGQVVFEGETTAGERGIWRTNADTGALELIIKTGDYLDIDGVTSIVRTFFGPESTGNAAGVVSSFSDNGEIAIQAEIGIPNDFGIPHYLDHLLVIGGDSAAPLPADFDGDGRVDGDDFLIWQLNFGTTLGATRMTGDADGDGDVDGDDFLTWQAQLGTAGGRGAGMPEPATAWMLLLGSVVLARSRCSPRSARLASNRDESTGTNPHECAHG